MKSSKARINSVELHWQERGAGDAVVLLHAFPLHSGMWAPQLGSLPQDRHWIAPDVRGFGRSASGSGALTLDTMADDVAALLDHLGHERATICGVSMGGYATFAFWRRHRARVRSLVLCATRAGADDPPGKLSRRVSSERVRAEGPAAAVSQLLDRLVGKTTRDQRPGVYERVRALISEVDTTAFARAQAAMAARPDSTAQLSQMDVPALVVVGAEDAIIKLDDARALARGLPQARFTLIESAGHLPSLERPDEFDRALLEFLE